MCAAETLLNVLKSGDEFFRTGDVITRFTLFVKCKIRIDDWSQRLLCRNEDGHLFRAGRSARTFRWKGQTISVNAVEEVRKNESAFLLVKL